jgi:REP element-mobilizing transposase RayT
VKDLPQRKPNRLRGYDYSQNGAYFVTLCIKNRANILGHIIVRDGLAHPDAHPDAHPTAVVQLSEYGRIAKTELQNIPTHYNGQVMIDRFVVMPNHIHAIIMITVDGTERGITANVAERGTTGRASPSPTTGRASPSPTLGNIVGGYKAGVSRRCGFSVWQRSYHDHIIRDEADYLRIAAYIENNPAKWVEDRFYVGDGLAHSDACDAHPDAAKEIEADE